MKIHVTAVILAAIGMSACGGGGGGSSVTPTSPTPTAAPAPAPITVSYSVRIGGAGAAVSRKLAPSLVAEDLRAIIQVAGTISVTGGSANVTQNCTLRFNAPRSDSQTLDVLHFAQLVLPQTPVTFDQSVPLTVNTPATAWPGLLQCRLTGTDERGTPLSFERDLPVLADQLLPPTPVACVGSPTVACLRNGRFRASVTWRNSAGQSGPGQIMPQRSTDDQAVFYFLNPTQEEIVLRLIDVCVASGFIGVGMGGPTPRGYELILEDVPAGLRRIYSKPEDELLTLLFEDRTAFRCVGPR